MKKVITLSVQIIIFLAVVYLLYVNIENVANISYISNKYSLGLNTSLIIGIFYFFGLLTGMIHSLLNKSIYRSQIEFYSRKNEKLAQQNEIDTDNKEALERKIATLEIALQNALKNKE